LWSILVQVTPKIKTVTGVEEILRALTDGFEINYDILQYNA